MRLVMIILVFALSLSAEKKEDLELQNVMGSFSLAMELIQHGILHNDIGEMNKGAQMLKRSDSELFSSHGKALLEHMPNNPEFAKDYAKRTGDKIRSYADILGQQVESGRKSYSKIAATYTHILQECVGCHQKVRRY